MEISMNKIVEEAKRLYDKGKTKVLEGIEWAKDHPQETVAITGAGAAIIGGVSKAIRKHEQVKLTTELKDLYVYDKKLGHYWKLRKPLSNNQWIVIQDRQKSGERLGDILASMKVLA